jgi:hypothetical protein
MAEVVVVVMRCRGRAVFCITPIPLYLYFINVDDFLLEDAVCFWWLGVFRLDVAVFFLSWLCGFCFDAALGGCVAGHLDDTVAETALVATCFDEDTAEVVLVVTGFFDYTVAEAALVATGFDEDAAEVAVFVASSVAVPMVSSTKPLPPASSSPSRACSIFSLLSVSSSSCSLSDSVEPS